MKPLIIFGIVSLFYSPLGYSENTRPKLQEQQDREAKNLFESRRTKARENQQENLRAHEVIKQQKQQEHNKKKTESN